MTQSRFYSLVGLCMLSLTAARGLAGDLLVTSSISNSVLRYDGVTGAFQSVFIPPNSGGLSDPWGITVGPNGNVFVTSEANARVLEYSSADGSFIRQFADTSAFGAPGYHAWGPDGNLYVSMWLGTEVIRFNGQTGASMGVFATDINLLQPDGLLWMGNDLLVSNSARGRIQRYDATTGAFLGPFAGFENGLINPTEIAAGPDGLLYIASFGTNQIRRYAADGSFIDVFAGGPELEGPVGAVFGGDGGLYVSSFFNSRVVKYDATTGALLGIFASGGGLENPNNIRFIPEPTVGLSLAACGFGLLQRRRTLVENRRNR